MRLHVKRDPWWQKVNTGVPKGRELAGKPPVPSAPTLESYLAQRGIDPTNGIPHNIHTVPVGPPITVFNATEGISKPLGQSTESAEPISSSDIALRRRVERLRFWSQWERKEPMTKEMQKYGKRHFPDIHETATSRGKERIS